MNPATPSLHPGPQLLGTRFGHLLFFFAGFMEAPTVRWAPHPAFNNAQPDAGQRHHGDAYGACRGMVEVIAKLQEAAERAKQAAAKLEAGASSGDPADMEGACQEYEAAAEAVQEAAQATGIAAPAMLYDQASDALDMNAGDTSGSPLAVCSQAFPSWHGCVCSCSACS